MPNDPIPADGQAVATPFSRRRLLRAAAVAAAAAPAATAAAVAPRAIRASQDVGPPATGLATPETDEGSRFRPQETVASPEPQVAAPEVGRETAGPPLNEVDPGAALRLEPFLTLSAALVGGGRLDERRAAQYLAIVETDAAKSAALDELLALDPAAAGTPLATPVAAASADARALGREILSFWYLAVVDDQPVTDRAAAWFGLSAWQAVRYTPPTSVCKAFGAWADPPPPQG